MHNTSNSRLSDKSFSRSERFQWFCGGNVFNIFDFFTRPFNIFIGLNFGGLGNFGQKPSKHSIPIISHDGRWENGLPVKLPLESTNISPGACRFLANVVSLRRERGIICCFVSGKRTRKMYSIRLNETLKVSNNDSVYQCIKLAKWFELLGYIIDR